MVWEGLPCVKPLMCPSAGDHSEVSNLGIEQFTHGVVSESKTRALKPITPENSAESAAKPLSCKLFVMHF